MNRRLLLLLTVAGAACTEVSTDPDTVVALRFDGSSYPSIVVGDSLRDSLGVLQPLKVTALNFEGEPVPSPDVVFSSPDTNVRVGADGNVFATRRKADGTPVRVFATVGALQTQPDSLFVVPRANSITAGKAEDVIIVGAAGGTSGPDSLRFTVRGDTAAGTPPVLIPSWLVSFQLRYRGTLLAPTDTSIAFTFETRDGTMPRRVPISIDTTDAQGLAGRRVFFRSLPSAAEDTIFLVATIRSRTLGAPPISNETRILLRRQ